MRHLDQTINRAGVYTIWRDRELVYAGYSGKDVSKSGPVGRLLAHRNGGRSGDKFCIWICDRHVLPELTSNEIQQVVAGTLKLDERTRDFIRAKLTYRFARCENQAALEDRVIRGALGVRPTLNSIVGDDGSPDDQVTESDEPEA